MEMFFVPSKERKERVIFGRFPTFVFKDDKGKAVRSCPNDQGVFTSSRFANSGYFQSKEGAGLIKGLRFTDVLFLERDSSHAFSYLGKMVCSSVIHHEIKKNGLEKTLQNVLLFYLEENDWCI